MARRRLLWQLLPPVLLLVGVSMALPLLDAMAPPEVGERRWKHPIAGWLDTPDWLGFIYAHTHHHRAQLRRIRTAMREHHAATGKQSQV